MPAPICVIIPTLNAAATLPATADALLAGVSGGLIGALVVSDGGSSDATHEVARGLGAVLIEGEAGRGGQIARAVDAAGAPWVLILHADTCLCENWVEAVARHMARHPDKAGYFRLRFRADGPWPRSVAAGANLRSRILGLPYGDQGLLVRRDILAEVGGVPDVPLMEDVILARRLRGRLIMMAAEARTSADRYQTDGWARRVTRNLWTLARFAAGASPQVLAVSYDRHTRRQAAPPN
jgi:rSAM/selenodomain-associated transferase 2